MRGSIIILLLFILSCSIKEEQEDIDTSTQILKQEFKSILDSSNVEGSILIFNLNRNTYYSNDFLKAQKGHLPASTFKIVHAIIGLETGVIKNKNSIFKWDGKKRFLSSWEKDLNLQQAFQLSCVPCFQTVARDIGVENMNVNLKKLTYGKMDVNATNLDNFWLQGNSKITPFEQIDFLKKLYFNQLPISNKTYHILKDILKIKTEVEYTISGKTGWSTTNKVNNGWFVGYVESNTNVYFFATNIVPLKGYDISLFANDRKKITTESLRLIKTP